jgi:hypothetical protein
MMLFAGQHDFSMLQLEKLGYPINHLVKIISCKLDGA